MNTKIKLLGLTSLALVACGDNKSRPDAARRPDGPPQDAYCSDCPAAPTIGTTQIDRMGRPAINTALNQAFTDATPTSGPGDAAKDAYNADKSVGTWRASYVSEFAQNLAILDVLDGGLEGNGICEQGELVGNDDCSTLAGTAPLGCGNQIAYSTTGTTNVTAYGTLAGLLADDRLYLDTSRSTCGLYLAVEFGVVTGGGNTTCGGRAPAYDVIDFTYSVTALGIRGFSTDGMFTPQFGDNVAAHTDLLAAFPYLGAPH